MSLRIKSVGNERQKRECRGSQYGSWCRVSKSIKLIVLVSLLVSLLTTSHATLVSAQDDFIYFVNVAPGKVITFTECNYHEAWFLDCDPNNWPDQMRACSEGNTAYAFAPAASFEQALALVGVDFVWDFGPYTLEEVKDWPVNVTIDFSYHIEAHWPAGYGAEFSEAADSA